MTSAAVGRDPIDDALAVTVAHAIQTGDLDALHELLAEHTGLATTPRGEEYGSWFKALADGTRVQIVSLLARAGRPMSVGEIVAAVAVGQSTVSAHLKVLAEVRFLYLGAWMLIALAMPAWAAHTRTARLLRRDNRRIHSAFLPQPPVFRRLSETWPPRA